jgi:hypothetical protein
MPFVRVPPNRGPQIVVTNSNRHLFDVDADGLVQCETQSDADLLVQLIEGTTHVQSEIPNDSVNEENTQ